MRISDWSSDVCSSDLIDQQFWARRQFRSLGWINYRNIVDADATGDADFLEALQQAVIERLVGIYFLLVDIILDAAATQVEIIALTLLDLGLECFFLLLCSTIVGEK